MFRLSLLPGSRISNDGLYKVGILFGTLKRLHGIDFVADIR